MNIPGPFDVLILAVLAVVAVSLFLRLRRARQQEEQEEREGAAFTNMRAGQYEFIEAASRKLRGAASKNEPPTLSGVGPIIVICHFYLPDDSSDILVLVPHGKYRRLGPLFLGISIRGTAIFRITADFSLPENRQIWIVREFPDARRSEMSQEDFKHVLPELLTEVTDLNIAKIFQNKENLPAGVRFDPISLGKNAEDPPCRNCGGLATTEARVDGSEVRIPCCDDNPCRKKIAELATEQAAECGA